MQFQTLLYKLKAFQGKIIGIPGSSRGELLRASTIFVVAHRVCGTLQCDEKLLVWLQTALREIYFPDLHSSCRSTLHRLIFNDIPCPMLERLQPTQVWRPTRWLGMCAKTSPPWSRFCKTSVFLYLVSIVYFFSTSTCWWCLAGLWSGCFHQSSWSLTVPSVGLTWPVTKQLAQKLTAQRWLVTDYSRFQGAIFTISNFSVLFCFVFEDAC